MPFRQITEFGRTKQGYRSDESVNFGDLKNMLFPYRSIRSDTDTILFRQITEYGMTKHKYPSDESVKFGDF